MNFSALTAPQAALLAFATSGAIIALYFLKLRHRRVLVSSSVLWQRVLDEKEAHSLWEKLRKILSIALAVLIGLLIALGLARPEVEWLTGKTERVAIVLDSFPTMLTQTADGRTRWQRAVDAAMSVVDSSGANVEFRVADTSGRFDSPWTRDRREVRRFIEKIRPAAGDFRFPEIGGGARAVFISDGVSGVAPPAGAAIVPVFERAGNVGVTAFEIRSTPSTSLGYEAYLEVHNYGTQRSNVDISVSGAGGQRITRRAALQPGESFTEAFDLSRFDGGGIRAAARSDSDAFPLDDAAYAYLPVRRKTRALLVTEGNAYLETVLKLNSLVELSITRPSEFRDTASFDAYILDRFAPTAAPGRPALIIGAGAARDAAWLPRTGSTVQKPALTAWMEDHPVMQHVSLHDVSITAATQIDASNLTVLASSSGRAPLIVASERPRWILLAFDLQSTDFPFHAGFPVFAENALAWLSRERLALHRAPGVVEIPIANAVIRGIDGRDVPSRQYLGATVFEAREPGLYTAETRDSRQYVAVNLTSPRYSAVNRTALANKPPAASNAGWLRRELWFYMLGTALVLVSAEWLTYHRRITL